MTQMYNNTYSVRICAVSLRAISRNHEITRLQVNIGVSPTSFNNYTVSQMIGTTSVSDDARTSFAGALVRAHAQQVIRITCRAGRSPWAMVRSTTTACRPTRAKSTKVRLASLLALLVCGARTLTCCIALLLRRRRACRRALGFGQQDARVLDQRPVAGKSLLICCLAVELACATGHCIPRCRRTCATVDVAVWQQHCHTSVPQVKSANQPTAESSECPLFALRPVADACAIGSAVRAHLFRTLSTSHFELNSWVPIWRSRGGSRLFCIAKTNEICNSGTIMAYYALHISYSCIMAS